MKALWYKLMMVITATSVTFILGLNMDKYGNYIALFLSSILTVLTTKDQFQQFTTRHLKLGRRAADIVM